MNFKIKLDFCVIPTPYSRGIGNLAFIAYRGTNRIDEKLCLEEDYDRVRNLMNQYGYQEIDFCIFESSNNTLIGVEEFKYKLVEAGLKYSKPFEFNIMGELESFNLDILSQYELNKPTPIDNNIYFSTTSPSVATKPKSRVPQVGEKITLYFYLFLQCNWVNENDCVLELIGDLYSKENNNTRNFLQITKSDFVRLDSNVPNAILLQSTKTYGDFLNEINLLHNGRFKFVKPMVNQNGDAVIKTKEFTYNILEIRKNINPVHRIVVEQNQYYDSMISVSKSIKKELSIEQKKIVSLENLRPEMLLLKNKLKDKMLHLAETDEFEKASVVKKDINFIDNKISIIDNLEEKNITREEYLKTFCLNL